MVDIAQLVEHLIVVQKVARSSRVIHPTKASLRGRLFSFLPIGAIAIKSAWRFSLAKSPFSEYFPPLVLMRGRNLSLNGAQREISATPYWDASRRAAEHKVCCSCSH